MKNKQNTMQEKIKRLLNGFLPSKKQSLNQINQNINEPVEFDKKHQNLTSITEKETKKASPKIFQTISRQPAPSVISTNSYSSNNFAQAMNQDPSSGTNEIFDEVYNEGTEKVAKCVELSKHSLFKRALSSVDVALSNGFAINNHDKSTDESLTQIQEYFEKKELISEISNAIKKSYIHGYSMILIEEKKGGGFLIKPKCFTDLLILDYSSFQKNAKEKMQKYSNNQKNLIKLLSEWNDNVKTGSLEDQSEGVKFKLDLVSFGDFFEKNSKNIFFIVDSSTSDHYKSRPPFNYQGNITYLNPSDFFNIHYLGLHPLSMANEELICTYQMLFDNLAKLPSNFVGYKTRDGGLSGGDDGSRMQEQISQIGEALANSKTSVISMNDTDSFETVDVSKSIDAIKDQMDAVIQQIANAFDLSTEYLLNLKDTKTNVDSPHVFSPIYSRQHSTAEATAQLLIKRCLEILQKQGKLKDEIGTEESLNIKDLNVSINRIDISKQKERSQEEALKQQTGEDKIKGQIEIVEQKIALADMDDPKTKKALDDEFSVIMKQKVKVKNHDDMEAFNDDDFEDNYKEKQNKQATVNNKPDSSVEKPSTKKQKGVQVSKTQ